jgi:hypothetical protein
MESEQVPSDLEIKISVRENEFSLKNGSKIHYCTSEIGNNLQ